MAPSALFTLLSKAYGLPGLRIGWIACQDRGVLARMERMKHYLSICNAAPSERLAVIALRVRGRTRSHPIGSAGTLSRIDPARFGSPT
jgi:aspartate/methionine/tyrosine aminotransferase